MFEFDDPLDGVTVLLGKDRERLAKAVQVFRWRGVEFFFATDTAGEGDVGCAIGDGGVQGTAYDVMAALGIHRLISVNAFKRILPALSKAFENYDEAARWGVDIDDPLRAADSCLTWLWADYCVVRYTGANGWQTADLLYVSGADRSGDEDPSTPGPWEPLPENELRRIRVAVP